MIDAYKLSELMAARKYSVYLTTNTLRSPPNNITNVLDPAGFVLKLKISPAQANRTCQAQARML